MNVRTEILSIETENTEKAQDTEMRYEKVSVEICVEMAMRCIMRR